MVRFVCHILQDVMHPIPSSLDMSPYLQSLVFGLLENDSDKHRTVPKALQTLHHTMASSLFGQLHVSAQHSSLVLLKGTVDGASIMMLLLSQKRYVRMAHTRKTSPSDLSYA